LAIQLSFHGAARTVTGSKYLLNVNGKKILIDCGMFQGPRELRVRNWDPPPFKPSELDAVVITHGHIDHIGYLPRLVKQGYEGKIFATAPTVDIGAISLMDTAHLQEEDAEYRNKNKLTRHPVALPLFTTEDAVETIKRFYGVAYDVWTELGGGVRFRYHDAGHILGAAGIEMELKDEGKTTSIFFSGDIGRYGNFLASDPSEPPNCDYLVCESTYGGRVHPPEDPDFEFINLINETIARKTILLIPAFAVGRTQQIIYIINHLIKHKLIPSIDIHVDSPMAITATDIYKKYRSYRMLDDNDATHEELLNGRNVYFHRDRNESKLLNRLRGPAIIISASGMLSGGRILHHMINRLPDPNVIVALVGFMAEGTLGRKLMDGEKVAYIHKTMVPVRAKIVTLQGLSGHADYYEILHWLEPYKTKPRKVFVTHGEISQAEAMAIHLISEKRWDCMIPSLDQTVTL